MKCTPWNEWRLLSGGTRHEGIDHRPNPLALSTRLSDAEFVRSAGQRSHTVLFQPYNASGPSSMIVKPTSFVAWDIDNYI